MLWRQWRRMSTTIMHVLVRVYVDRRWIVGVLVRSIVLPTFKHMIHLPHCWIQFYAPRMKMWSSIRGVVSWVNATCVASTCWRYVQHSCLLLKWHSGVILGTKWWVKMLTDRTKRLVGLLVEMKFKFLHNISHTYNNIFAFHMPMFINSILSLYKLNNTIHSNIKFMVIACNHNLHFRIHYKKLQKKITINFIII